MQRLPGRVVVPQQGEHVGILKRVAPTADDRQQFRIRVEPFQGSVNLAGDLRLEIGAWSINERRIIVRAACLIDPRDIGQSYR